MFPFCSKVRMRGEGPYFLNLKIILMTSAYDLALENFFQKIEFFIILLFTILAMKKLIQNKKMLFWGEFGVICFNHEKVALGSSKSKNLPKLTHFDTFFYMKTIMNYI